ncbi:MAG: SagB/ThcOx family dehydrogenase [Nitrospira sp.]|nr:SagB/ThcOx family dehydrogenase [Nitrospira sp.]
MTKHHFHRYARSLGYLDWGNQPDPFRRYAGAELIRLPLLAPDEDPASPPYRALFDARDIVVHPLTQRSLSRFLELALALSAWKRAGESEWALRSNPSSGNLHPTEGYVLLPTTREPELAAGLYHYAPREHGLERRAEYSADRVAHLLAPFPAQAFILGLTSVHWREAWKYGERAFRYCQHDVGHAIGAARISAATLGWRMVLLDGAAQDTAGVLLGTNRREDFQDAEPEHPNCLAVIWPCGLPTRVSSSMVEDVAEIPLLLDSETVAQLAGGSWYGKANRLSRDHGVHWGIIDEVAEASWKTQVQTSVLRLPTGFAPPSDALQASRKTSDAEPSAGTIIRRRRSAVAFDGRTSISSASFFRMLRLVMPGGGNGQLDRLVPWDVWPYEPAVHLMLFVHRIDGLTPGLYFLLRDPAKLSFIQEAMNPELVWSKAPGAPDDLPLYWLLEGDAKKLAVQVSCHQDIAGDGAFSFGMLAEFEGRLRKDGAWWYPRLFWESGLLGQVLYLEAEEAGVRATGIGCFFDDPVHEILAVKPMVLQSLYHFTVGGPIEDRRLLTLPPYYHLQRNIAY